MVPDEGTIYISHKISKEIIRYYYSVYLQYFILPLVS